MQTAYVAWLLRSCRPAVASWGCTSPSIRARRTEASRADLGLGLPGCGSRIARSAGSRLAGQRPPGLPPRRPPALPPDGVMERSTGCPTEARGVCKRAPIPSERPPRVTNICSSLQLSACAPGLRPSTTSSPTHRLTRTSIPSLGPRTPTATRSSRTGGGAPAASHPLPHTACARSGARRTSADEVR